MVRGHVGVDGIGQNSVVTVEKVDDNQSKSCRGAELRKCSHLLKKDR